MPSVRQQLTDVSSVSRIINYLLSRGTFRRRIVYLGVALIGCYSIITFVQRSRGRRRLACIRERKLINAGRRKADLQRTLSAGADQSSREAILRLTYPSLCTRLQSGDLTPAQVLDAYQWRALRIDRDLNCINEVILEASELAISAPKGRLHGIPMSVKEAIAIEGLDATGGNTSTALRPKDRSAVIIRAIVSEGALPFVQTNMAQGGRGIDCNNALFGETLNPHDPRRSPGGSSGGEAALIAAGGSILGLGSDIGGSIRIPACLCGIFGFKPTAERISHRDLATGPLSRLRVVQTSYGPLSRDLEAAVDLVRVLCSDAVFKLDPMKPSQHFSESIFAPRESKPLTIGFYSRLDDPDLLPVTPAVARAVETAVRVLTIRGHRMIPWSPPRAADAVMLTTQAYALDGGRAFMRSTRRELLTPDLVARRRVLGRGYAVRTVLGHLVSCLQSPITGRQILATRGARSVDDLLHWCGTADSYRQEFLEAWESSGLDALICPVLPFGAALPCGETHALRMAQIYAQLYNFLDCPAGSVPVTRVNAEDLHRLRSHYPDHDTLLRRLIRSQAGSEGLPVSVQVVSAPWHDEVCLRAMKELRDGLRAA